MNRAVSTVSYKYKQQSYIGQVSRFIQLYGLVRTGFDSSEQLTFDIITHFNYSSRNRVIGQ